MAFEMMHTIRKWLVGLTVTVAGVGQLIISHEVLGWLSGVLANTGTATLLFAPLLVIQRTMEARIEQARTSVEALSQEIENTQDAMRQTLAEIRDSFYTQDEQSSRTTKREVDVIGDSPSCLVVHRALSHALERRVISPNWGLRVHVVAPDVFAYARLLPIDGNRVNIWLENRTGEPIADLNWEPNQAPADLMSNIVHHLRTASLVGDHFDPTLMFIELREAITKADGVKKWYAVVEDMACAQEYVPPQWIIYDWGLGAWHGGLQPYYIMGKRLDESDLFIHMREKRWLHEDSFYEALTTARALKAAGRIE
jgi:hypothetical protein